MNLSDQIELISNWFELDAGSTNRETVTIPGGTVITADNKSTIIDLWKFSPMCAGTVNVKLVSMPLTGDIIITDSSGMQLSTTSTTHGNSYSKKLTVSAGEIYTISVKYAGIGTTTDFTISLQYDIVPKINRFVRTE